MSRVGVFLCHCGNNIGETVLLAEVAELARALPGVVYATEQQFLCSEGGQTEIRRAISDYRLERVVIGACAPWMHEGTFRQLLADCGLSPYFLEMADLREGCAWLFRHPRATKKAQKLVTEAVKQVVQHSHQKENHILVRKNALVLGGGIAGIQAALDIAAEGYPVTLVERSSTLGGRMLQLDKTFPTLDCSACIAMPKMAEVARHPKITLLTDSELVAISGSAGDYQVTIRQKARYVDHSRCTGCGLCEKTCPVEVDSEYEQGLTTRKAIYRPTSQALPAKPVIDATHCITLNGGFCETCAEVCPQGCIRYQDEEKLHQERYGTVIVATGHDLLDWPAYYGEYGTGDDPDILTGLQLERLLSAAGPTGGRLLRPSDGKAPRRVVLIQCVGSRDPHKGKAYCSRTCCMAGAKQARQLRKKLPETELYVCYIDVRACGKGYEEFYQQALGENIHFLRGRVAKIFREGPQLYCQAEDTLLGQALELTADLVVLETAQVPAAGSGELAALLEIRQDKDGFFAEAHPKLRPVESSRPGIFLAGSCQAPKDITDTVAQASAAAAKACQLLHQETIAIPPTRR